MRKAARLMWLLSEPFRFCTERGLPFNATAAKASSISRLETRPPFAAASA